MHLGTSTAILLAFSLFGDLCGPKKPPEQPREATPAQKDRYREYFESNHKDFVDSFAEYMARIEMHEAKYQDKDAELTPEAKKTAMYPIIVKQHDDLVARTEAIKGTRDACTAYYEAHKQEPTQDELQKLVNDNKRASNGATDLASDYDQLNKKVQNLVYDSR